MINVVVTMWQGNIEDVSAFARGDDADRFFEDQTGTNFKAYTERSKEEDTETILGNYAGSNIWELKIK